MNIFKNNAFILSVTLILSGMAFAADQTQSGQMSGNNPSSLTSSPRASQIIGMEVIGANGQRLGTVKDLIIGAKGAIDYLIISGTGSGKMTAIPWDYAAARFQSNKISTSLSKDLVDSAPTFADWNEFNQDLYQLNVDGYYGQPGSPLFSAPGTPGSASGPETGPRNR